MLEFVRDLMAHAEWANAQFFGAWTGSPARENLELRERIQHIMMVQVNFLMLLRGEIPIGPGQSPPRGFDELKSFAQQCHADWHQFLAQADAETLAEKMQIPWFPDPLCIISKAEAIVQVAMHSQHHRGQCMTRLRDFGGEPQNVDFIIWLWKQKERANWA